jgi:phage FluMu protein Com
MTYFKCRDCNFVFKRSTIDVLDDSCPMCKKGGVRIVEDYETYYRLHNDFDSEVIVCASCLEGVNDGVDDDRELYCNPVVICLPIGNCYHCDN